ncbi:MAG: membrane protein insertase YidC [Planctomycetes bacterium]|nr:membrane protein insertase YidC [Planctomycetota bacterium]
MLKPLFVSSFLLAAFAVAQNPAVPEPRAGTPIADVGFVREFGTPGAPGSFRARLSRAGAGLAWLQATDHYVSLDAARKTTHGPEDWLLLATSYAGAPGESDHALRLLVDGDSPLGVDPATAEWTAVDIDGGVKFTLPTPSGLVLEKVLRHDPKARGFVVEIALRNESSTVVGNVPMRLLGPALVLPHESSLFGQLAVSIAAATDGTHPVVHPKAGPSQKLELDPKMLSFAGSTNRFFGAFLWPADDAARAAIVDLSADTLPYADDPDSRTHAATVTRMRYGLTLAVPPANAETRIVYGLYLGPKSFRVFETLPEPQRFAPILDVDLTPPCCGVEVPGGRAMAKLLLRLLGWFHDLVGNWGLAIVMLTILVRGLLSPLNYRMQKSMRAYSARMAVLKPKIDALQKKHADDKAALQQAMVALQREHKLIPPLGGCLPIFLTMPIYIGLFTALRTAYDVRQRPFVGWIDDLSRADNLLALPFFPHQLNLLPIVWMVLMAIQTFRQPLPTDPQQRQTMMIMRYMPLVFGVMLYGYASALMVYMVTSMVWTFVESAIIKKKLGPIDPNVAVMAPTPM